MYQQPLPVRRTEERFVSESSRVIARLFLPGSKEQINHIIRRVLDLSENDVKQCLGQVIADFSTRHKDILHIFGRNLNEIKGYIPDGEEMSEERQHLIGAFFTHEYSIQAAAFFNPSIVMHMDQSYCSAGSIRFILSFRSTGEGHISSIEFRSGILDAENNIRIDEVGRFVETPEVIKNPTYDKYVFMLKLEDMGWKNGVSKEILAGLPDIFPFYDLQAAIQGERDSHDELTTPLLRDTTERMLWLAKSNYELRFSKEKRISEKVIFPVSENESGGIEDARFVCFCDDNGYKTYYATYTAYNGFSILPMLLETRDFNNFKIRTLNGKAVQNKGMALFPKKINGKYMMISRQDGENMFIMSSDNLHFWHEARLLQKPRYQWEFIQIGNCGSPLETEEGWLLLTHGVGPMRRYCIGACLLDLEDPTKVIGRLSEPLLSPTEEEREGYVPNVLYTCGAMIHNEELILPYSMSDTSSGIAVVPVRDILSRMLKSQTISVEEDN